MSMIAVVVTTAISSAPKPTVSEMAGRSVLVGSARLRWTAGRSGDPGVSGHGGQRADQLPDRPGLPIHGETPVQQL